MTFYYSTKNKSIKTRLEDAVMGGLAEDGGLYMPGHIPKLEDKVLNQLDAYTFPELAFELTKNLLGQDISHQDLKKIVDQAINFEAPLKRIHDALWSLELFHGPTLSFKDFGARFMGQLLGYFLRNREQKLHILVATSGDTGSAIGQALLNVPGIQVWILYPKAKISLIQEKQLSTMGHNITALELEGTFDDCQKLVKEAFADKQLRQKLLLSSANSINIARLIPQSFYYFYAYAQLKQNNEPCIFSVPSGNFGNLTAGLLAKKMGLKVSRFIAATNINDTVPQYLQTGIFKAKASKQTLSNAMDVGNPSNFARILDLYQNRIEEIRKDIFGISFNDEQTKIAIKEVYTKHKYLLDPHGAVAYLGLSAYFSQQQLNTKPISGIALATAHPGKFADDVAKIIGQDVNLPSALQEIMKKKKLAEPLTNSFSEFKNRLLASEA